MSDQHLQVVKNTKPTLTEKFADRFGVAADKLLVTLKATAFSQSKGKEVTNAQMMALLVVADQHKLNPFTKEIYAFPDKAGIVPVVSVDGWLRMVNDHRKFDGMEFETPPMSEWVQIDTDAKLCPQWITCVIHRADRNKPTKVTEYLDETYRPAFKPSNGGTVRGPWQSHTKRMLRHKAIIQAARIAFSFSGIYDEDEAHRIVEGELVSSHSHSNIDELNVAIEASGGVDADADGLDTDEPVAQLADESSDTGDTKKSSKESGEARQDKLKSE